MAFKLEISFAERRFYFMGILICLVSGTLRVQSWSMQPGSFAQEGSSLGRLPAAGAIPESLANTQEPTATDGGLADTPLSARCKFSLFLRTTYSPYAFASAGFGATWAQATGQWPHYGGGMQGWGKRFGATLANTESRRFIQTFAFVDDLASGSSLFYFAQEDAHFPGVVFRKSPEMTMARACSIHPSFWALCSLVRYKTPTTQDMTEISRKP